MEEYKQYLIRSIMNYDYETLEEVESRCITNCFHIINRNSEGKMHSRYLGDRYEPAIQCKISDFCLNYYLFDGDIRDCAHPFSIKYWCDIAIEIIYYSSERIKNEEPMCISRRHAEYNQYWTPVSDDGYYEEHIILNDYKSQLVCRESLSDFSELCEEMDEPLKFKFAD